MSARRIVAPLIISFLLVAPHPTASAQATQTPAKPYEPTVGQAGKDVVWVPTPQELVEKMLDMAKLTPQDFLMDLGSGDGRTVITAARRGARALGIEYNPDMVGLARQKAAEAKVSDRATFQEADLYEIDLSKAQVITMFLLPSINMKLRPKLLDLRPGTRIVSNSFTMEDWQADQTETITGECTGWCTALVWIVPAKVEGTWQLGQNTLTLTQQFQTFRGTLGKTPVEGRLNGADISFTADGASYKGMVDGRTMKGTVTGGPGGSWTATKK
jgi:precorrin-6B methylase 2